MKLSCVVFVFFLFFGCSGRDKFSSGAKRALAQEELGGSGENTSVPLRIIINPQERPEDLRQREEDWDPPALPGIGRHFNAQCRNFIQSDGSYGPWGLEMIDAMRSVERHHGRGIFFGDRDTMIRFGQRCKSTEYFQSLTRAQQEHIWVWFWASVAQAESSCRPGIQVNGIWNPRFGRFNRADGLFQLEYHTETRNANGRDRTFCPNRTNTQAISFQTRCAASIMADTQGGDFLMDSDSYWLKLRRQDGGGIFNNLWRHPLCSR